MQTNPWNASTAEVIQLIVFIVKKALVTIEFINYRGICYLNKRKNNNPKVQINMNKLKICFIWLRTPHVFPLSNLKRIPN